jgi:hypothetical protein
MNSRSETPNLPIRTGGLASKYICSLDTYAITIAQSGYQASMGSLAEISGDYNRLSNYSPKIRLLLLVMENNGVAILSRMDI